MDIKREQLKRALEIVKPGLANRELIEQTTSFGFLPGLIVTYNDEISISHPIPLDITGAVKATELYALLGKIEAEDIDVTVEGKEVGMKAGRVEAGFTLQDEMRLPLEEIQGKKKWKSLPKDFTDAIDFTRFSCSKDMSKPILTAINVTKTYAESSDNYRATRYQLQTELPCDGFLIPAKSASELLKYKPTKVTLGKGWAHFQNEEKTMFSARIYGEHYTTEKLTKLLDVKGHDIKLPKTITNILDRAGVFAKRDFMVDEQVQVAIKDKTFSVYAKSMEGWVRESVNINYKGTPIEFTINPKLLQDILKHVRTCVVGTNRVKFTGDVWEHIVGLHGE